MPSQSESLASRYCWPRSGPTRSGEQQRHSVFSWLHRPEMFTELFAQLTMDAIHSLPYGVALGAVDVHKPSWGHVPGVVRRSCHHSGCRIGERTVVRLSSGEDATATVTAAVFVEILADRYPLERVSRSAAIAWPSGDAASSIAYATSTTSEPPAIRRHPAIRSRNERNGIHSAQVSPLVALQAEHALCRCQRAKTGKNREGSPRQSGGRQTFVLYLARTSRFQFAEPSADGGRLRRRET
jgi:hypothetical protein